MVQIGPPSLLWQVDRKLLPFTFSIHGNLHLFGVTGNFVIKVLQVPKGQDRRLIDSHGIMKPGGFDIAIGNPPYVECKDVKDYRVRTFETELCGDLYAFTREIHL